MPRKYVPKTRRLRKNYRKGKRRYAKRNMLSFSKAPIPNTFSAKLRYADYHTIDPDASGFAGSFVLSANGLWKPNITGTGHQPRGFDQWMTMFDHYTVVGSKVTVRYISVNNAEPLVVGVNLKDSFTTYVDKNDYEEGRNVRTQLINSNTNQEHKQLSMTFSARKFLGVSKPLSNHNIRGGANGNPSEQAYFHIWGAPLSANNAGSFKIQYWVDYLVVFTEPVQPSQS